MEDFELFKAEFTKWQEVFGLSGYRIYFEYVEMEELDIATIDTCIGEMFATVRFNSKATNKNRDIRQEAKHEAVHLLLGRIVGNAQYRYATRDEMKEAEEELVNKLTLLIKE